MRNLFWTAVFLLTPCSVFADWRDQDYVVQAFNLIALNNEYDNQQHPIRKWHQPIRMWLDHRVGDEQLHTQLVEMQVSHLAEVTGHDIAMATSLDSANFHVVFTQQSSWQDETRELIGSSATNLPLHSSPK